MKPPVPAPPVRKIAPHVQSAVALPVQRKLQSRVPDRQPAPHVQAAITTVQTKAAPAPAGVARQAPHVQAALATAPQLKPGSRAPGQGLNRTGSTVQRASMDLEQGLGFQDRKIPTGYGAVLLRASINGIDLGPAWSTKPRHTEGTEHAEDNVIEYVQTLIVKSDFNMASSVSALDLKVMQSIALTKKLAIVITDLTASPCSSAYGTTKEDKGCAEKLIEMMKTYTGVSIAITADHYYQPHGVAGAKEKSAKACDDMKKAGITVTITNP